MIDVDRHVTYAEININKTLKQLKSSPSNFVYNIVNDDESWIYQYTRQRKKNNRLFECFKLKQTPQKLFVLEVFEKMIALFVTKIGHIGTVALEDCRIVNANWYTTICLPELNAELIKNNTNRFIILKKKKKRLNLY